jgi:PAS domain S-box-containing protein
MSRLATLGILLDHAQDKVALVDEHEEFTYVNAAAERILGFEPDQLVGENAFEHIHPDDVDTVRRTFGRVTQREEFAQTTVEYRFRARDGSWVWLESRLSNLTDSALDGYVVSSRDVTDRVKAEQRQRETDDRLSEIAAVSDDVLWMFSADWSELLFLNSAYEEIYGMSVAEIEQRPERFLESVHPDDVSAVTDAMERLSAGESVDMEYRVNADREYTVWVWVQAHAIVEDGEVVRIAGFSRDVTDRRRRERQLAVMDNLLRHNLRNELNVILGTAARIEEAAPDTSSAIATIRRAGEQLLQSAEKQREIIDLLNDRSPRLEQLELRTLVEESASQLRSSYPEATIAVSGIESAQARASAELPLAVAELLENVVQHCDEGAPRVEVSVRETRTTTEIVVEDDLPPIPEIESNVLRGNHDTDAIYHSSGLGFWLVYWTVELSNGDIAVHSEEGRGNRITLSLPRVDQ